MITHSSSRFFKHILEKVYRAFAGIKSRPDIFISATSSDLGTLRKVVKDALLDSDCFPVEQSHFAPDYRKVEELLRSKIRGCQALIHIVGVRYGCEPDFKNRPANTPRRSYTQMEYDLAKELGIRCYVFVCPENFPYDDAGASEAADKQKLQHAHRQQFLGSDMVYTEFNDRDQLKENVLKLQNQLFELRERINKNMFQLGFAVLMNWLLLVIAVGGVSWSINKLGTSTDSIIAELKNDSSPERLAAQAAIHFDGKNYASAFQLYAQVSEAAPADVKFHRRIEECARLGHLERTFLDRYLVLVQQHPTNAVFLNYLGNAYLMLDPTDKEGKSRASYEAALLLDPQLAPPMANLGILASRAGKRDEAEALFKRYLTLQPDDAQSWVNLSLLYLANVQANTNDIAAVLSSRNALKKAIEINPSSSSAYKALGRLCMTTGQMKEAWTAYQRSLALNNDQPDIRELLASAFGDAISPSTQPDDFTTRSPQRSTTNSIPLPAGRENPVK